LSYVSTLNRSFDLYITLSQGEITLEPLCYGIMQTMNHTREHRHVILFFAMSINCSIILLTVFRDVVYIGIGIKTYKDA